MCLPPAVIEVNSEIATGMMIDDLSLFMTIPPSATASRNVYRKAGEFSGSVHHDPIREYVRIEHASEIIQQRTAISRRELRRSAFRRWNVTAVRPRYVYCVRGSIKPGSHLQVISTVETKAGWITSDIAHA